MGTKRLGLEISFFLVCISAYSQATVNGDGVPVYLRMDAASAVVATLKKGDAVVVEMSILGKGNVEWCSVRQAGPAGASGYVRCDLLERPARPRGSVAASQPAESAAMVPPTGDRLWDLMRRDSRFGAPGHPLTLGEQRYLGQAGIFDVTFRFSLAQQQQVLNLAIETGVPACVEDTNRYVRQGTLPPDIFTGGPLVECDWVFHDFTERAYAVITPQQQAAHRASYEEFGRELAGERARLARSRRPGRQ